MQAYIHGSTIDSKDDYSCSFTQHVQVKIKELWWQKRGMQFTASGYGSRIPTRYMVKFNDKWRRVYCRIYSNSGTLYIGKLCGIGERLIVSINN